MLRLKVVKSAEFENELALLANVRERLGPDVQVEVDDVDRIERTRAGTFRDVISRVRAVGGGGPASPP